LSKLQFENEEKFPIFIIGDFKMFINEDNNVMKLIIGQNFNLKHLGNTSYVIHNIQNEEINVIEQPEYDTIKIVFCRNESPVESETVNIIFNSNDLEEFEEKTKTTTSPQNIIGETQVLENYYNKSPKSNSSNDSWTLV
jgi:hypothetical protein